MNRGSLVLLGTAVALMGEGKVSVPCWACIGRCMDNSQSNRSEQSPALEINQCVADLGKMSPIRTFEAHPELRAQQSRFHQ